MTQAAAAAKEWLQAIFAHDVAEKAQIMRAATANGFNLDPQVYARPFPGTQSTTNITLPPKTSSPGLLAAGALLLGSVAGAAGVGLLSGSPSPPQQPAPVVQTVEEAARVRVYWGEQEITPGQSASSGDLEIRP